MRNPMLTTTHGFLSVFNGIIRTNSYPIPTDNSLRCPQMGLGNLRLPFQLRGENSPVS